MFGLVEHQQSGLEFLLDPIDDFWIDLIFNDRFVGAGFVALNGLSFVFRPGFFDCVIKGLSSFNTIGFVFGLFLFHDPDKILEFFFRDFFF